MKNHEAIKGAVAAAKAVGAETPAKRMLIGATGPGGVKGIVVPRHMWEGGSKAEGMREINKARAEVYGGENRPPLTLGEVGNLHKAALVDHFSRPIEEQLRNESAALGRLRAAKHIGRDSDTLDESEKLDTVKHEHDPEGRSYTAYASKGVAGHSLYTSGAGANEKKHVINTCPGQTKGCGGGIDANGIVDTKKGTCFAPNAESQYVNAAVRRACHEQAKHDPAMSKDWILAHTGSLRAAAERADKKNLVTLFRPNVVDETDVSSRHAIAGLNAQRAAKGKPRIIANSYGKTNELHDPENGYYVTHSNVGPKTKLGQSVAENISRDRQRVRSTITATDAAGRDFVNEQGHKTPPKNSYMVTDVKRYSDLDRRMQAAITHAKYWSAGRDAGSLGPTEAAEPPEAHYGPDHKPTTPDRAHYGHETLNGKRYDYQKQHILHPRMVQVGHNEDGTPHIIPTDSRFKDDEYLPKHRYRTKNGKNAGAILMTTPTTSTSDLQHQSGFTHHVNDSHVAHALANNGEYEIDPPAAQEAAAGREYAAPRPVTFRHRRASGGAIGDQDGGIGGVAFPEADDGVQEHLAHREPGEALKRDPHQMPDGIEGALAIARRLGVFP